MRTFSLGLVRKRTVLLWMLREWSSMLLSKGQAVLLDCFIMYLLSSDKIIRGSVLIYIWSFLVHFIISAHADECCISHLLNFCFYKVFEIIFLQCSE